MDYSGTKLAAYTRPNKAKHVCLVNKCTLPTLKESGLKDIVSSSVVGDCGIKICLSEIEKWSGNNSQWKQSGCRWRKVKLFRKNLDCRDWTGRDVVRKAIQRHRLTGRNEGGAFHIGKQAQSTNQHEDD